MKLNVRIGGISKIFSPSFSQCRKCKTTWLFVKPHVTVYKDGNGAFPLCEKCWSSLTPSQRTLYYNQLLNEWKSDEQKRNDLLHAVLLGK